MEIKIILDALTESSVSVATKTMTILDGKEYIVGEINRCVYVNSKIDRERLVKDLDEKYINAIFSVWGNIATIVAE